MNLKDKLTIRARLIYVALIVVAAIITMWYLSSCACHVDSYNDYIFQPWQRIRTMIFKHVPISIGDIMYFIWGISLVVFVTRMVYFLINWDENKSKFWNKLSKGAASLAGIYLFFMIGWGGNYFKEPLRTFWHLDKTSWNDNAIVEYDKYLVKQLNVTVSHYNKQSFKQLHKKAVEHYRKLTDCAGNGNGLHVKPSIFGNLLQYMGVQGYFNPFTGEGQVNDKELPFMLPYIISHEIAHQSGIGAEDDANLLAYAVSVQSSDSSFMYSAYFSLWLYTHMQVRMRDTNVANNIKRQLNEITLNHLEELRTMRKKYRSKFSKYTGDIYDQYLKLNHQKDGVESYDKVTVSAWAWERKRLVKPESKIYIP